MAKTADKRKGPAQVGVRVFVIGAALLGAIGLCTCNDNEMLEKIAPKAEVEFARWYLDHVRTGEFGPLERYAGDELRTAEAATALAQLRSYFPRGEARTVKLVGSHVLTTPQLWRANLSFEYGTDDGWALATLVLDRKDGSPVVRGVQVYRIPDALERIHAFTFRGKGVLHFVFLGAAVLVFAAILGALVLCLRTRGLRMKWLWALFILFGFAGITLNWTTGQVGFQLLSFHLFGTSATAGPYSPWMVTVSAPIGAFLFFRKWLLVRRQVVSPPQPQVELGVP